MYKPTAPRQIAAFLVMDIQENAWLAAGCRRFAGYAKLERIFKYLIETEDA